MRISCPESVFEMAVVSLLLQNTTIRRTTQMMNALLTRYGTIVRARDWRLRAFFSPGELGRISEAELREFCRLGYRAKYLPRFAEFFGANDDESLTGMDSQGLQERVRTIKGVGPYTANVLASHALRDPDALPLDVWNRRLLAKALFEEDDADPKRIRVHLERKFPGNAGMAALYLIEHVYIDTPVVPLEAEGQPTSTR